MPGYRFSEADNVNDRLSYKFIFYGYVEINVYLTLIKILPTKLKTYLLGIPMTKYSTKN